MSSPSGLDPANILFPFRNALRHILGAVALLATFSAWAAAPALRPEIDAFIEQMAKKHAYDAALLRRVFAQAQSRPAILRAMAAPATARPWYEFRRRTVEPVRIEGGVRFWLENALALERASREFGVPEEIIVATIGIETLYGRNTGNFKVIDALSTLAFDYPPRADYFKGELEHYLLLAREANLDATGVRGSYAGAIGVPQFMPSSYRKYGVDFDGDGKRDLVNSTADAIGSVANYYRSHGWKMGGPVTVSAEAGDTETGALVAAGLKPHITVRELKARGLTLSGAAEETAEAAVFSVETEAGPRVLLGFNNFYVITRYNRSVNYAMAVHELAQEVKAQKTAVASAAEPTQQR
jgi:peptidoglycan lytic transglycosylase B